VVFVILSGDGVLVERRAGKGLLGGMLGLPHTDWRSEPYRSAEVTPPLAAAFEVIGTYEHVFTHFALTQEVWRAQVSDEVIGDFLRHNNGFQLMLVTEKALPTVFAKALKYEKPATSHDLFD
jgi:A/G-specific adenine glycosylase